jgi:hypothetical protein
MKNWKTTAMGILGGCLTWLVAYLQTGRLEPKEIATGVVIAGIGVFAKDLNVTGGSVEQ